jgi:hypothetical protein
MDGMTLALEETLRSLCLYRAYQGGGGLLLYGVYELLQHVKQLC